MACVQAKSHVESPRRRVHFTALCFLLSLFALWGCGAKTGLDTPDIDAATLTDVRDVRDAPDVQIPPICINPAPDGGTPLQVALAIEPQVLVADVLFMIDRTGSMDQEIANIRTFLRTVIVPGLVRTIPDLMLGLVTYGDFPIDPYGSIDDRPFSIDHIMTRDFVSLQGAISNVRAGGGGDNPEAMVEALYQVATGAGLLVPGMPPRIPPSNGCPTPGTGYACVRSRATPIIVLMNDAPSHNGPNASNPYSSVLFQPGAAPRSYATTLQEVRTRLRAKIIGINSGVAPYSGRDDLVRLATDTNTVDQQGQPLVFDIGPDGTGLSDRVVTAIGQFIRETPFDVTTRVIDIDGSGASNWVLAVTPVRADPMQNIRSLTSTSFLGVLPGTHLDFNLELDRSRIVQTDREQRFTIRIEFLADGRPSLGFRDIVIVVPPRGTMCMN